MKSYYVAAFAAMVLSHFSFGQQEDGIAPYSIRLGLGDQQVPVIYAAPFDADAAFADDQQRAAAGLMPLYGRMQFVGATLQTHGLWTDLPNGDRLWRLKIVSEGALANDLFFDQFHLPPGALFHVYDPTKEQIHGAFMDKHVQAHGQFTTDMIFGETCIIEYFEPYAVQGEGHFTLTELSHAYRMVGETSVSDACEVDVNCSEGSGWEEQRDAVVRIRVVIPEGTGWCSGVLMNNTDQNCRPYILTALHCGLGSTEANFHQYLFKFRYQRQGCITGTVSQGNQMTGCVHRADSDDDGGEDGSDFLLVELNDTIPFSHTPYYAGWSAANLTVPSGKSIHHPSSDMKKISTFTSALQTSSWGVNGTHWRVVWSPTENGAGVTEPGSSGSPIFDQDRRVVGTLTGGASCCVLNDCGSFTGPNQPDYYGKLSHHWTGNPNTAEQKLSEWLNPGGGTTIFDGSYDPCNIGTSVEENPSSERPEIYPNPSTDGFTVEYPSGIARADLIEITDLSGRIIFSDTPMTTGKAIFDATAWSAGTYLVNVIAKGVRYAGAKVTVEGR
ncbi:MAG: T9SS type A sorting domain-containing protein [Bacteroidota bacterium]|nr:T9SS type A sorting domain-containing protein [Bacteroidota bacterium]